MSTVKRLRTALAGRSSGLAAATVALAFAGLMPAAAVTIDTFSTNQANVSDPPGTGTTVTGGADIVGTRRGLVPDLLAGAGPVTGGVAGGALNVTVTATTPDSRGEVVVTWDGDTNPNVLAPTGLGGVDLTGSNHSGFRIVVNSATAGSELVLEVYTDGGKASRAARRLPAVVASTSVFLSYASDFVPFLGTGADFTDVGAIVLTVRGTETSTVIDLVETAAPAIAATKQDRTIADVPIAGPVAPGATYKYRVVITNTGTEAQTVDLADTIEPNLTIATSTIDGTPALINDAYDTFGNIGETVAAPGLLGNDVDPDQNGAAPALVVTAGAVATALGGSATLAADGSFTYDPPIGVGDAVDTFTYTATDNEGNAAVARATIHIGSRIWFVDSSHGGSNQGTFQNPFTSITATNLNGAGGAGDLDQPGDILFVYAGGGPYNVGLILEAEQQLIGQGSGLTLQGETIVPAGAAPTFTNGAGNGITLASNNSLMGFTVGNTTGTDIVGNGFGTLTLSNVTLNGTGGALDLITGALAATFNSISSTNAPARGINLDAATGSLVVTGGTTITDSTQAGIRVVNGGSTYNFGATTLNSTNSGLDLATNATSTFTFASLAVTTDAGPGLFANNSGTLNIGGSGNSIAATGGAAVDITSTSLGAGATFSTLSSTNSTGKGVNLDTVAGTLTATAGSISNSAGICFDVNGGSSNIAYAGTVSCTGASRLVEITGRTGGTITLSGNLSATGSSTGINVANNSVSGSPIINFSGSTKTLNTGANAAVTLDNNDVATINFTGGGLDIDTTSGAGFNAINGAAAITVQGSGNTIDTGAGTALNVSSSTIGSSGLTFQRIVSSGGTSPGIHLSATGAGGLTVAGAGGSCTSAATCTGGAITAKTGSSETTGTPGVRLDNVSNVRLSNFYIANNNHSGIYGTTVHGFQLSSCLIENNGDNTVSNPDETGVDITNLTGTAIGGSNPTSIDNTTIRNNKEFELQIANSTGTLTDFQMNGNSISSNNNNTLDAHGNLFNFIAAGGGNATMTLNLVGGSYTGNANPDGTTATAVHCDHSGTGGLLTCNVSNAAFTNNNVAVSVSSAQQGNLDFTVSGNTATQNRSHGLNLFVAASSTGTVTGEFTNNIVGTMGTVGSGSQLGFGVRVQNEGSANTANPVTVLISGNTVQELANFAGINTNLGIALQAFTRTANITVQNNLVREIDNSRAVIVQQNNTTAPGTVCSDISGNTFSNVAGNVGDGTEIRLRQLAGGTFNLEQASLAALATANGITAADISVGGTVTFGGPPCPLP